MIDNPAAKARNGDQSCPTPAEPGGQCASNHYSRYGCQSCFLFSHGGLLSAWENIETG